MSAKIVWQTKSPVVVESFLQKRISSITKGGNTYNFYALMALAQCYDVAIDKNPVKHKNQSFLNYLFKNQFGLTEADVIIKEIYPVAVSKINSKSKNVAVIHHIDENYSGQTFAHKLFFKMLQRKLPKMDLIIVVSEFWKRKLQAMGCDNIHIIYNSFDLNDYVVRESEVATFRKKYSLSEKPIVYIGNAHAQKGAYEAYNALKNLDVELIMTGNKNNAPDIPVRFLALEKKDYITLLHVSNAVVLMSKLCEGWNRVAHEALLCHTPVIGSGSGGMSELLTKANQVITTPENLEQHVIHILNNPHNADSGFEYVKQFDMNYFNNAWQTSIKNLLFN